MVELADFADSDGVLRVRAEPGPNMRWFEQGFFLGLGFATATFLIWVILAIVVAVSLSR